MSTRFKVIKKDDRVYYAVALRAFTNVATGKAVDENEKSGCFDSPDTLSQNGTAWIFEGSDVKESSISGNCGIVNSRISNSTCSGSALVVSCSVLNCYLTHGVFSDSSITNLNMSFNYSNEKENRKYAFFVKSSSLNFNDSTELYGHFRVKDSVLNTATSDISNASFFNCNLVGTDIDIANSDIHNVIIKSNIRIIDSSISFCKESKKMNPLESNFPVAISNADVSSPAQLRIISDSTRTVCGYRDNSYNYIICSGYDEPSIINSSNYLKNLPKRQKNNLFCEWFATNKNVDSFIGDEVDIIKRLFPSIGDGLAETRAIRQVFFFDLLCLYMVDRARSVSSLLPNLSLLQLDAVGFEQDLCVDISNSSLVAPGTHFFFSKLLKETIMTLTNLPEEEVRSVVLSIGKERPSFHYLSF